MSHPLAPAIESTFADGIGHNLDPLLETTLCVNPIHTSGIKERHQFLLGLSPAHGSRPCSVIDVWNVISAQYSKVVAVPAFIGVLCEFRIHTSVVVPATVLPGDSGVGIAKQEPVGLKHGGFFDIPVLIRQLSQLPQ